MNDAKSLLIFLVAALIVYSLVLMFYRYLQVIDARIELVNTKIELLITLTKDKNNATEL